MFPIPGLVTLRTPETHNDLRSGARSASGAQRARTGAACYVLPRPFSFYRKIIKKELTMIAAECEPRAVIWEVSVLPRSAIPSALGLSAHCSFYAIRIAKKFQDFF